jgi:flagellar hook-associated protein 2
MGTVGLNFGAASSGTGFDVTTTVASIVGNLQAVETPWNTQLTSLKADDTALTSIGTDLGTLTTNLRALTDFEGVLATKEGASSDTNVLTLSSAGPTASAGSHTIVVSQLAQTSSKYSSVVPSTDTLSGSLTFSVGTGGTPQTVPVVGGTSDTLASYAAAINSAGIGVTASIVSDASGSRLSLVSGTSGAGGQLTITGALTDATTSTAVTLHSAQAGQDALLTVDGLSIDSPSNTVSTAIPGVTFQLLSAAPATQVQVQVVNDNTDAENAFSSFVTSYNAVVKDLATQESNDATGKAEPLYGNPIISQLQSALSLSLTSGAASGAVKSLDQLGISVNQDGTLKLDASTLNSVLNSNYTDVVGFMQNIDGFGMSLATTLSNLGSATPTGAVTLALAADTRQETVLKDDVTAQDALIATQKISITTELTLADEALQGIPQQLNEVNELYSALTGYNTKA